METKQIYTNPSNNLIREFIKEMRGFSKEELEGVIHCIESDTNVTYPERARGGFVDVIHGTEAICVHLMASSLLKRKAMNWRFN